MGFFRYHLIMSNPELKPTPKADTRKADQRFDIAVVGAGIVGKACALGLAQLGYSVAQISPDLEKTISLSAQFGQRIYAISPGSREFLDGLQIWSALNHQRIQTVRDMRIFGDQNQNKEQLHFSAFEVGKPELAWICEADLIEQTLDQACRFNKNRTPLSNSVNAIHIHPQEALLDLDNQKTISAQMVIAADGANSPLRSAVGIHATEESYEQKAVVANFICTTPHLETAYQWFLPQGDILAMLPLPNQEVSMVWSCSAEHADQMLQMADTEWEDHFEERANGAVKNTLGSIQLNSKPASFILKKLQAQRLIGPAFDPKVILLGDAAHVIHPLAGQGLNLGLRDVATLLKVIGSKEAFRKINDPLLLRRYERQRQGDTNALIWVTDRLKKLFGSNQSIEKNLRHWGLGFVNRSHFIKRQLIKQALGENHLG